MLFESRTALISPLLRLLTSTGIVAVFMVFARTCAFSKLAESQDLHKTADNRLAAPGRNAE
jgi:hypothetical protein